MTVTDGLFEALTLGPYTLPNRIFMAPLTRNRAEQPGDVPWRLNAEYYQQRAGAGLIISEASQISPRGKGYPATPGIYSAEQVLGWKAVTDAVHEQGARMYLQLWHVGRISHPDLQVDAGLPVAPSAIKPEGQAVTEEGMKDFVTPRALEQAEISEVVAEYRIAAENAMQAGFDGVEVHAANGYLIDQFLRDASNQRTDAYGGSVQNRLRFGLEVVDAVIAVVGKERVGVRVSPYGTFNDMSDSNPINTFGEFAQELSKRSVSYLHVVEGEIQKFDKDIYDDQMFKVLRKDFSGVYIGNGFYSPELAAERLESGAVDAVAFGRPYIANPDLVERIKSGAPLNEADVSTFYGGDEKGYTDYPFLA